jgi:hypothetical protein
VRERGGRGRRSDETGEGKEWGRGRLDKTKDNMKRKKVEKEKHFCIIRNETLCRTFSSHHSCFQHIEGISDY